MGPNGPIWIHLDPFGPIQNHLELFGAIWNYLEIFGAIRSHKEPFGTIWSHFWECKQRYCGGFNRVCIKLQGSPVASYIECCIQLTHFDQYVTAHKLHHLHSTIHQMNFILRVVVDSQINKLPLSSKDLGVSNKGRVMVCPVLRHAKILFFLHQHGLSQKYFTHKSA